MCELAAPYYADGPVTLYAGDCIEVMRGLPAASVDAVVTDPPYGLEFMGRDWDGADGFRRSLNAADVGRESTFGRMSAKAPEYRAGKLFQDWCELWATEALRVLKPGGHLLAFGGTRTFHRLTAGIEDAGFEIRDSIAWLYGSGFPKSRNLDGDWQGWGTALKPAFEPIVVARKPLIGTVAANVLAHGTGALNIDANRIGNGEDSQGPRDGEASATSRYTDRGAVNLAALPGTRGGAAKGRWPANVILNESQARVLDEQSGIQRDGIAVNRHREPGTKIGGTIYAAGWNVPTVDRGFGGAGGASRFFYTAKAATEERPSVDGVAHPTVKPLDLMRWLVRLVTPKGGTVLEPFAGSGTTVEACVLEGFDCIAIEREETYLPLILKRVRKPHHVGFDFGDWDGAAV